MNSPFDLNLPRLLRLLLPIPLRRPRIMALLGALVRPLVLQQVEFARLRSEHHYRMSHNGQTCYLRAVLCDRFDPQMRGIDIADNTLGGEWTMLHTRSVSDPVMLPRRNPQTKHAVYRRALIEGSGVRFFVMVPRRLEGNYSEDEMRAVVNEYKMAGIQYGIKIY